MSDITLKEKMNHCKMLVKSRGSCLIAENTILCSNCWIRKERGNTVTCTHNEILEFAENFLKEHEDKEFNPNTDSFIMEEFITFEKGCWYTWVGDSSSLPFRWVNKMRPMLKGIHQCNYVNPNCGIRASFIDIPNDSQLDNSWYWDDLKDFRKCVECTESSNNIDEMRVSVKKIDTTNSFLSKFDAFIKSDKAKEELNKNLYKITFPLDWIRDEMSISLGIPKGYIDTPISKEFYCKPIALPFTTECVKDKTAISMGYTASPNPINLSDLGIFNMDYSLMLSRVKDDFPKTNVDSKMKRLDFSHQSYFKRKKLIKDASKGDTMYRKIVTIKALNKTEEGTLRTICKNKTFQANTMSGLSILINCAVSDALDKNEREDYADGKIEILVKTVVDTYSVIDNE